MFKKYPFLLSLIFSSLLLASASQAQTTGSFDTTISFMGGNRSVSLYVPTAYNPVNKYRLMICLHGLGDTCTNYRNTLINSLGWSTGIPNTIFVCPEALTTSSDYYSPAGGEAIVQQSITLAMSRYHIDSANVVLQGFSLGGRAALRYGLDNYGMFKGLLLNTPAVQGVKEAINGRMPLYGFTYANAGRIPIYITHGSTDITYASSIDSSYEQLALNDGKIRLTEVAGLGHAIPALSQMSDFSSFFISPARPGKDVEAVRLNPTSLLSCTTPAATRMLFRNAGQDTITSVRFKYTVGSSTQTGTYIGTLLPFQHAFALASFPTIVPGDNAVTVQVDSLNGLVADTVLSNNQAAATLHYEANPVPVISEGFEGADFPPSGWVLEPAGDFYSAWDVDNTVAKTGSQSMGTFNTIFIFDNAARKEGVITPLVAVGSTHPQLSFDVAYNYHEYTPPYTAATLDFADTLEVLVSTDCGAHYNSLYKKGGAQLATFAAPILNPLSIPADFINPADSNWRTERIDLSSLTAGGHVVNALFKFSYISALGGSINIDNVNIASVTGIAPQARQAFRIYPNPAMDVLTVEDADQGAVVRIMSSLGQIVLRTGIESSKQQIPVGSLPAGNYVLLISNKNGTTNALHFVKQ